MMTPHLSHYSASLPTTYASSYQSQCYHTSSDYESTPYATPIKDGMEQMVYHQHAYRQQGNTCIQSNGDHVSSFSKSYCQQMRPHWPQSSKSPLHHISDKYSLPSIPKNL